MGDELFPIGEPDSRQPWILRNERWTRVIHRGEDRLRLEEGRSVTLRDSEGAPEVAPDDLKGIEVDGGINADVPAGGGERWVYLYLDPSRYRWRNYRWTMNVRRMTDFRELQFGFRYVDFYNRYRFRHEDGAVRFDIVDNGRFFNNLAVRNFEMELGRDYRYEITVLGHCFELRVDDEVLIRASDPRRRFPRGPLAVILWQDDGRTPLRAWIGGMRCRELLGRRFTTPNEDAG